MAGEVKVTTVIPTHIHSEEARRLFERTLVSVLGQTVPPAEVLVIDDGSSLDLQNLPTAADVPVVRVPLPHRGPVTARNVGAELARTELVHVLDHDDRLAATFYERIVAAYVADGRRASVIHGTAEYRDADGNDLGPRMPITPPHYGSRLTTTAELMRLNCVAASANLFTRGLYRSLSGFDDRYPRVCDWHFWLRAVDRGARFLYVPEAVGHHTRHDAQLTARGKQALLKQEEIAMLSDLPMPLWIRPIREYKIWRIRRWIRHLEQEARASHGVGAEQGGPEWER